MNRFGRYQLYETKNGFNCIVESCENDDKERFWVPMVSMDGELLGHLLFVRAVQGVFELTQIRSASCPIHTQSAVCKPALCLQTEATE